MIMITGPHLIDGTSGPIKAPTLPHKGKAVWRATNIDNHPDNICVAIFITWEWADKK